MEPQTLPKSIPKGGWSLRTLQGPILTPFWELFGTIWRAFGDHLDHLGTILGAFGTIWDHVGTMLGALEAVWEQFRSTSDQNSSYNGTTRQNYQEIAIIRLTIIRIISKPLFAPGSLDKPCESHDFALALSVSRAKPGLHAPPGDENRRKINKKSKLKFVYLFRLIFNDFSLKFDSKLRQIRI